VLKKKFCTYFLVACKRIFLGKWEIHLFFLQMRLSQAYVDFAKHLHNQNGIPRFEIYAKITNKRLKFVIASAKFKSLSLSTKSQICKQI